MEGLLKVNARSSDSSGPSRSPKAASLGVMMLSCSTASIFRSTRILMSFLTDSALALVRIRVVTAIARDWVTGKNVVVKHAMTFRIVRALVPKASSSCEDLAHTDGEMVVQRRPRNARRSSCGIRTTPSVLMRTSIGEIFLFSRKCTHWSMQPARQPALSRMADKTSSSTSHPNRCLVS